MKDTHVRTYVEQRKPEREDMSRAWWWQWSAANPKGWGSKQLTKPAGLVPLWLLGALLLHTLHLSSFLSLLLICCTAEYQHHFWALLHWDVHQSIVWLARGVFMHTIYVTILTMSRWNEPHLVGLGNRMLGFILSLLLHRGNVWSKWFHIFYCWITLRKPRGKNWCTNFCDLLLNSGALIALGPSIIN